VQEPENVIDIFLQPGEFFFGDHETRLRTLLGSCVAITMWHPARRIGGMCHFLLPTRGVGTVLELDGRYGDEALALFLKEIADSGTNPKEYQVKLFGGGDMFSGLTKPGSAQVGQRNVDQAQHMLTGLGFPITAQHVGGEGHRNIIFDVWSGDVWVRYQELPQASPAHKGATRA
jgi:chemotaxis protein CheD